MKNKKSVDWAVVVLPLAIVIIMCFIFFTKPNSSKHILDSIRIFLNNELGFYFILIGLIAFIVSIYIGLSDIGKIKFGKKDEKPKYSFFAWGAMIFTSTMAADILFYALGGWTMYLQDSYIIEVGIQKWAPAYALFHWGPIPWSFYVGLAVCFGYMLHIRKNNVQKISEACRPIFKDKIDGILGKSINIFAIVALLAGTSTTFSLATPLLSQSISVITGIPNTILLDIFLLVSIAIIYTVTVLTGMKGISKLATLCTYIFFVLLGYFFFLGNSEIFILETGISSIGTMIQNFIPMATWCDPARENYFPQNWTIFYWAYWMVWCVATPFFMAKISKGRTIKQTVFGGYFWGLAGTFTAFIVFGNYGLSLHTFGKINVVEMIGTGSSLSTIIVEIFLHLPFPKIALTLLVVTMIAFYATTFDALTYVVSLYSYKTLSRNVEPSKAMRVFWSAIFILFPISLLFSQSSLQNLQTVSLIGAFPIGIIFIIIIISFFKSIKEDKILETIEKE